MRTFKYFTAVWCGPCKLYGPVLKRVENDYDDLTIEKIDVDENRDEARKYQITSVPTVVEIGEDGSVLRTVVGAFPYNTALQELGIV